MQLQFIGRNIEVTAALKSFTEEKFKQLEKHCQSISHIHVSFHVEHITHTAEATVHLNGTEIHASAQSNDMYEAITALTDKLLSQITKHKEKTTTSHH